jgi:CDP-diacylglycerol--serine O-phosphatidyltransferase
MADESPKKILRRRRPARKAEAPAGGPPPDETEARRPLFRREDGGPARGVYLLPNLITTTSLVLGFWSITETFVGDYVTAAWLLLLSAVCDGLDGKVARLTGTASAFGVQYDSLADLVAFGVAPGFLVYVWALKYAFNAKLGWTIAAMYVICGALRLARYNVQFDPDEKTYMKGLAIPMGAAGVALAVLFAHEMEWVTAARTAAAPTITLLWVIGLAFLMISRIKYYSFKNVDVLKRRKFSFFVGAILFVLIVRVYPVHTLFAIYLAYMASGPVLFLLRRFREPGAEAEALID